MWQYCCSHIVYHMVRWLPENNRRGIRIVLLLAAFGCLVPELYVLADPDSQRFCAQHLLTLLIVTTFLTFCMLGFSVLFLLMDPIPWEVKLGFQIFGVLNLVFSIVLTVYVSSAEECKTYSESLYGLSVATAVCSVISMVAYGLLAPFWVLNRVKKNVVLDLRNREGLCYEPVNCCSCVWHI